MPLENEFALTTGVAPLALGLTELNPEFAAPVWVAANPPIGRAAAINMISRQTPPALK
jgi:hypothetical protein